jgi:hypothetical protein
MSGEIIRLPNKAPVNVVEVSERIASVAALFEAIEAGELLSAMPSCPVAREQHKAGLALLALIEVEIVALRTSLSN